MRTNVAIVGVGLLGGSLAAILSKKFTDTNKYSLWAFSSPKTLEKGKRLNIFDKLFEYSQLETQLENLDVVFLCSPVDTIKKHIEAIGSISRKFSKKIIVTDIGSTKSEIMDCAHINIASKRDDIVFIGGHPMAGSQSSGIDSIDTYLYENAVYILTPFDNCEQTDIDLLCGIVADTGASPLITDHITHDKVAAKISHLPQIVATALVDFVSKSDNSEIARVLAAGGFRDMTRIASSDFCIWKDILRTNKGNVVNCIDSLIKELQLIKSQIGNDSLGKIFENAADFREKIPRDMRGFINPIFEVVVRVPDKPGILKKITSLIADENINLKDFSVVKIRERISGSIKLGFETAKDRARAVEILNDNSIESFVVD